MYSFDIERDRSIRAWVAGGSFVMAFLLFLIPLSAFAQRTHYTDVPPGAYYEAAAEALLESNALDASETRLRPGDAATRAEVMKLLVNVYGATLISPSVASFSDVSASAWYYPYMETAAREGWLKGDGNCYGSSSRTCTARPGATVNRAEMAIILKRAFRLPRLSLAPLFTDNRDSSMWYFDAVQTAADHCVLQGDDRTGLVRPAATMNRAEMIVMFHRAEQYLRYGQDCAEPVGNVTSVSVAGADMIRVMFNTDIDPDMIGQTVRYRVEDSSNATIAVASSAVVDARTVNLRLGSSLKAEQSYRLVVSNMRTENGAVFNDTFNFEVDVTVAPRIDSITQQSSRVIRLRFTGDVDANTSVNASKYLVQGISAGGDIGVTSATRVDARTVDLTLASDLGSSLNYQVYVVNMLSATNQTFSDNRSFTSLSEAYRITNVSVESATKVRVTFSTALNEPRAEQTVRYTLTDGDDDTIFITSANLMPNGITVELTLAEALMPQTSYRLFASDLQTTTAASFSDDVTFVYGTGGSVNLRSMLRGSHEVPIVPTAATGTGVFVLTSTGLEYDIQFQNLGSSFTAAHFHRGAAGVNGPVMREITFSGTSAVGTWTNLTNEERNAILNGEVYVNIHSANYPNGEIRGQLVVQ